MGRYITITADCEIDMDDIDDDDLILEIERRNERNKAKNMALLTIESDDELANIPILNLDFRMKFEAFMSGWQSKPFTEIHEFFTK